MARSLVTRRTFHYSPSMTFTGTVGTVCMFPLRAIIRISVALGISPNTLTLVGVLINCVAGCALARELFALAGLIMICPNIVDFPNRMAAVLWVILVLSIVTVANRIHYPYLALNQKPMPGGTGWRGVFWRAFFWRDERTTIPYDLWVIAILAFVWLTPPGWLHDPVADGQHGFLGWLLSKT